MKLNKILLLIVFSFIGIIGFTQTNITVTNNVDEDYVIRAVYVDGGNSHQVDYTVSGLSNMTLYYYDQTSGYSSYELDHWKIFLKNCYGQISAEHYYGTTDTDAISHCNYCDNVANSYYIPLNNANNIDCRD